jgi:hypothetical protein
MNENRNNNSSKKFDSNYHLAYIVEIKKEKIDSSVKLNATQSPGCYKQVLGFFHEFLYKNFQNVVVNRSTCSVYC